MTPLLTLHHPAAARAYYAAGVWRDATLYALLAQNAAARPDAWAVRDVHRRLRWTQLLAEVDRMAQELADTGVKPGERVSIWLPSRSEAIIVLLACSRNGYVCNTSLHQNYTVSEIAVLLESIESRVVFVQAGYGADAAQCDMFANLGKVASLRAIYVLPHMNGPGADGAKIPLSSMVREFPQGPARQDIAPASNDPDKVTYLAFTSGTTGVPKSVMHSDNTLLANARAMVEDWGHGPSTVLCSLSPASHHIGTVALNQALVAGCELVMTDMSGGIAPLDWIEQTEATYVMGVPTHAIDILAAMNRRGQATLGKVGIFYMAGAPIPRETADRLLAMGIIPQNIYGMTENGSHNYTMPDDPPEVITGTCGRSCRAYDARIFDDSNRHVEVPHGIVGEIGGRGGMLMLGYFANQSATERTFNQDGYLMSGDLGRIDELGNLQVVGRMKDIIIRGGHNIFPTRIEDLTLRHQGVLRAAALPMPDDRLGERVCLAIVPRGADIPTPQDMIEHLTVLGLSKYDLPEFYAVMDEFPLTASGKILKRTLIEWHRAGRFTPEPIPRTMKVKS
jgi:acyl-CoA synthetase